MKKNIGNCGQGPSDTSGFMIAGLYYQGIITGITGIILLVLGAVSLPRVLSGHALYIWHSGFQHVIRNNWSFCSCCIMGTIVDCPFGKRNK